MTNDQLYPLAGPDGATIPLDIIRPGACCILTETVSVVLPAGYDLFIATAIDAPAVLYFTKGEAVGLPTSLWKSNSVFLPEGLPMCVALPTDVTHAEIRCLTPAATRVALQSFVKWQGAGLANQTTHRF